MNTIDTKRNRFFLYLFLISFVACEVVMVSDYFGKQRERGFGLDWLDEKFGAKENLIAELQEDTTSDTEGSLPAKDGDEGTEKNKDENPASEPEQDNETAAGGSTQEEQFPRSFVTVDYDYFDDALFIGDSRTVGLMEFGNLEYATFFADSGMSVFSLQTKKISVPETGKVSLEEMLFQKQYGKIYLMLGINELGYKFEGLQKKYQETIKYIRSYQEDAVIFLCANLHVTEEQSNKDPIYNNTNVNRVNEMIAGLADGITYFYIDVNELFDDENGNLSTEYSSDSFHVFGKDYTTWADWLCTKAIVVEQE